jgi:hypothetical protein
MHGGRHRGHVHGDRSGYGSLVSVLLAGIVAGPRTDSVPHTDPRARSRGPFGSQATGRAADGPDTGEIRASDAERDDVVRALSRHLIDGRIDATEFDERLGRALAAKTRSELASLLADLPTSDPRTPSGPDSHHRGLRIFTALVMIGVVVVAVAAIVISAL